MPRACLALLLACACHRDDPEGAATAARMDQLERRLSALEAAARTPPVAAPSGPVDATRHAGDAAPGNPTSDPAGTPAGRGPAVHLALATDGNVRLEGRVLGAAELDRELAALASSAAVARVEIAADDGVSHAALVELIERVRGAGLSRFAIVARGGADDPVAPE